MARDSRWFFAHLGGVGEVGVPPAEEVVLEFMEALASNEGEEEVVVSRLAAEVALMPWNAHLVGVLVAHGFDAATGSFPSGLSAETKKKLYQSVRHQGVGANPAPFPAPKVLDCVVKREAPVLFDEGRVEKLTVVSANDGQSFAKLQLLTACNYGKVYSGIRVRPSDSTFVATAERVAMKQMDRVTYERHVLRRRGVLNEDPVKEVAALQFLESRGGSDHVLPLQCCCANDETLFSVSPFCDGGDLFSVVERHRRLDDRHAKHFFKQLVRGLVNLHALGLAHHDLSLENVLWLRSGPKAGKAFIIDLGMAVKVSGPTRRRFLPRRRTRSQKSQQAHEDDYYAAPTKSSFNWPAKCGKVDYMSPELLNPTKSFDLFAVDVWALGVILYVLLVGSPPFDSSNATDHATIIDSDPCFAYVRDNRLNDLLTSWQIHLEPHAIDLLERLLDPEPTTRITIPQIISHPWFHNAPTIHNNNSR